MPARELPFDDGEAKDRAPRHGKVAEVVGGLD